MIVAFMGVIGCALVVAGVHTLVGEGPALIAAGVAFLAAAYITNRVLDSPAPPEPPETP